MTRASRHGIGRRLRFLCLRVKAAFSSSASASMSSRTSTILTIAGVTVLGGALAYAVYFDYKRRNDVEFRKKLREFVMASHARPA